MVPPKSLEQSVERHAFLLGDRPESNDLVNLAKSKEAEEALHYMLAIQVYYMLDIQRTTIACPRSTPRSSSGTFHAARPWLRPVDH